MNSEARVSRRNPGPATGRSVPRLAGAAVLLAAALAAQPPSRALLRDAPPPAPAGPGAPALQEIFADIGDLLRGADRSRVDVIRLRLRETEDELRLLESLKSALDRGLLVELPAALRDRATRDASPEAVERERKAMEELLAEVRIAEARRRQGPPGLPKEAAPGGGPSALARAALDVHLEIPAPPRDGSGTASAAVAALDPEGLGRALYAAGDFAGAVHALQAVATAGGSPEVRYLLARSLERLGRWPEAKDLYSGVAADDKDGPWGGLSRWMLRFGGHLHDAREVLSRSAAGTTEDRR